MKLVEIGDLLLTVTPNVFHFEAFNTPDSYIVWAEDGQSDSEYADDYMDTQIIEGTIDYFTKTEFDPIVNEIQSKLNSADISWRLSSIQHEEETSYIHYEWIWEVESDG